MAGCDYCHTHTHTHLTNFPHQGPTLNCGIHVIQNYAYVLQAWMHNPDPEAFIAFLHTQHIMLVPMSVLRPRVIEFLRNPPPRHPRRPPPQQAEISVDPPSATPATNTSTNAPGHNTCNNVEDPTQGLRQNLPHAKNIPSLLPGTRHKRPGPGLSNDTKPERQYRPPSTPTTNTSATHIFPSPPGVTPPTTQPTTTPTTTPSSDPPTHHWDALPPTSTVQETLHKPPPSPSIQTNGAQTAVVPTAPLHPWKTIAMGDCFYECLSITMNQYRNKSYTPVDLRRIIWNHASQYYQLHPDELDIHFMPDPTTQVQAPFFNPRPPTPKQLFSKHKKQYYYVDGPMIGHAANLLNIHITIIQQGQYKTTEPGEPIIYWPTEVFTYTPQSPTASTTPIVIEFINSRGAIGTTIDTTPKNDHYRPLLPTPPTAQNHIHDPPIPRIYLDSPLPLPPRFTDTPPTASHAPLEQLNLSTIPRPPRHTRTLTFHTFVRSQAKNQNLSDMAPPFSDPKQATEASQSGTYPQVPTLGCIKAPSSPAPKASYQHRYT